MRPNEIIIKYFRDQNKQILAITDVIDPTSLFRRLLYITLLDGLSKIAYPLRSGNRERFCLYLKEFADWEDGERISLTHLFRYLLINPEPKYETLRRYAKESLGKWIPGEVPTINKDPIIDEIRNKWPRDDKNSEEWKEIKLESFKHSNLLYEIRNSLVHEFRVKRMSGPDNLMAEPYYVHVTYYEGFEPEITKEYWGLQYPLSFMSNLAGHSLDKLEKHLSEYEYDFSALSAKEEYLIQKLNN